MAVYAVYGMISDVACLQLLIDACVCVLCQLNVMYSAD